MDTLWILYESRSKHSTILYTVITTVITPYKPTNRVLWSLKHCLMSVSLLILCSSS